MRLHGRARSRRASRRSRRSTAPRDQLEHLALALGQVARASPAAPSPGGGRRTKSSTSRRVTLGASSASPAATVRTASTNCAGGAVLQQEPAGAGLHRVVDVLVLRRRSSAPARAAAGRSPTIVRGSRDPVDVRHPHVHQDDVGMEPRGLLDAPRRRRPPRRRPPCPPGRRGSAGNRCGRAPGRRPAGPRSRAVSDRQARAHREAAVLARPGVEGAAEDADALAHADQPMAAARLGRRRGPSSATSIVDVAVGVAERDRRMRRGPRA